jgi:hypothetical protein
VRRLFSLMVRWFFSVQVQLFSCPLPRIPVRRLLFPLIPQLFPLILQLSPLILSRELFAACARLQARGSPWLSFRLILSR